MGSEEIEKSDVLFEKFYNKHKKTVYGLISESEADVQLREDIMQDIFSELYFRHIKDEKTAEECLTDIVNNEISKHNQNECIYKKCCRIDKKHTEEIDERPDLTKNEPLDAAIRHEMEKTVCEKIHLLKPVYRKVIVLRYYFDFTVKEISEIIGCPMNTVYFRLRSAERLLHNELYGYIRGEKSSGGGIDVSLQA